MAYEDELDRMRERRRRKSENKRQEAPENDALNNNVSEDTSSESDGLQNVPDLRILNGQDRIYQIPGDGRNPRSLYTGQPASARADSSPPDFKRSDSEDSRMEEAQRKKKKKKRKKRRILIMEIAALLVLLAGAYFLFGQKTHQEGYWTVAVFGVDSRDGNLEKGALSDVEMVCSINKATGEIRLLSVYRDTYLKIDGKGNYHKINEAYFKGGHEQAIDALNENLDIRIDDYATFNWKAVAQAINILGGVDMEITDAEFAYINSFITETVNSTGIGSYQLKHAGMNHLDGIQAVSYARLRLMDTDFNRTERQRKVVSLALEKAKQADFNTLKTLILTVLPQISTSIGVDDLIPLAKGVSDYHLGETAGFPFSRTTMKIGKLDCVIAATLESNVIQLHQFLYEDGTYAPSDTVKKISSHISEVSGIADPGKNAPSGSQNSGSGSKPSKAPETASETEMTIPETTSDAETEPSSEETEEESSESEAETEAAEATAEEISTKEGGGLMGPGAELTLPANNESASQAPQTAESTVFPETTKAPETTGVPETAATEPVETLPGPADAGPGTVLNK